MVLYLHAQYLVKSANGLQKKCSDRQVDGWLDRP